MIDCLTGLRAYLIGGVLLHHMLCVDTDKLSYGMGLGRHVNSALAQLLAKYAAMGVDIFFILSGFIIAYRFRDELRRRFTWLALRSYLLRRLARIWPVYALSLLALLAIHAAGWADNQLTSYAALPSHFMLIYAWHSNGESWNPPGWSVSAEFFCYLLFPLMALLYRPGKFSCLLCMGLLLAYFSTDPQWSILGSGALARAASEFFFGFLLYDAYTRITIRHGDMLGIAAGLMFLLTAATVHERSVLLVLCDLCLAAALLALTSPGPLLRAVFANKLAMYAGTISYSIYAMHYPVIRLFNLYRDELQHFAMVQLGGSQFAIWAVLLGVATSVLLVAALVHVLVERPMIVLAARHARMEESP